MRISRTSLLSVALLCGGGSVSSWMHAQVTTGQIQGTVMDAQSGLIPDVEVAVVNTATGQRFTNTSNEAGEFRLRSLPVGSYTVEVEHAGFKRYVRSGVEITQNQMVRLTIALEIGAVTETVNVSAAVSPVNTTSATVESLMETQQMLDLPVVGRRNVLSLASLMPSVTRVALSDGPGQQQINVNGQRSYSTNVTLDGAAMYYTHRGQTLMPPPPEALQEVKLITSGMSAEYGRGAAAVSLITRSGTNKFHGSAWNYLRNDVLDARSFFAATVPKLRYNQFGGTIGGPIQRDRAFFFFTFQGVEQRSDQVQSSAFPPTEAERAGDFSNTRDAIPVDPLTGNPFPNSVIPASRLDPVAGNLLGLFPLPNQPNGAYVKQVSRAQSSRTIMVRGDYDFSESDRTSVRYSFDNPERFNPFGAGNIDTYATNTTFDRNHNITVSHRRVFSPQVLLNGRFGFTWYKTALGNFDPAQTLADFGSNFISSGGPPALPQLFIGGRLTGHPGQINDNVSKNYDAAGDLSWFRGRHEIKIGGGFQRNSYLTVEGGHTKDIFRFDGTFTQNPFADFYLGQIARLDLEPFFEIDNRYSIFNFYVQDNWRVTPRLSLNLGLRWEIYEPFRTESGQFAAFVPGEQSTFIPTAPTGLVFDKDDAFSLQRDAVNAGPRIGFAYDLFGNGKTSLRGGYGISYDPLIGQATTQPTQPFAGKLVTRDLGPLSDPLRLVEVPFGPGGVPLADLSEAVFAFPILLESSFIGEMQNSYTQNINFTVDQEIWGGTLLELTYAAALGRKITVARDLNPATFIPGESTLGNTDERRPLFPTFGSLFGYSNDANSNYHALQVTVRRRFGQDLGFTLGYAYSKAIDEVGTGNVAHWELQDPTDRRLDRGLSDHDIRHRLVTSWIYDLPQFTTSPGAVRHIFGGWQFAGIATLQDGQPFTVATGQDRSLRGRQRADDRPDLLGDPSLPTDRSRNELLQRYFDTSQFVPNRIGEFGNAARNILIGPGTVNFDLSLKKKFFVTEDKTLQFRWEMFNAFNRPDFAQPRNNLNSAGTFGRITGAGPGRIMQVGLKFEF